MQDYFGGYFHVDGEFEISRRIEAALNSTGYTTLLSDNEHVFALSPSFAKALRRRREPRRTALAAADAFAASHPVSCLL